MKPDDTTGAPERSGEMACSAFAWDSMSNGGKLLLLTYAMLAVVARTWTETWRQADWPHELSLSTEADAFRRLTDRQNR